MPFKSFCLLLCLAAQLPAAQPWRLPFFTSDPQAVLAAASRYIAPERANAIVLDYSVRVDLDESGKMHRVNRTVTRVLRVQGVEALRRVSIAWAPWRENRPLLRARVITSDGQAHLLDPATVTEASIPTALPDVPGPAKTLSAMLPDIGVDSIIEVETEQSDREIAYPGGRYGEITARSNDPIAHFSASITVASAHELKVEPHGFSQVKEFATALGRPQGTTVEASDIVPDSARALLPPEAVRYPMVAFSTVANWQSIAQWYAAVIDKASEAAAAAGSSKVAAAVTNAAPAADPLKTIQSLFEDSQKNVRYTGVGLGTDSYIPHTPAETLKQGYGDAEDKAVLLIAKLAAAGISAKAALITVPPAHDVFPSLPGVEAFDHVLVYVPGPHPLWIDPTAEFTPVSRLPFTDQGRSALIIDSSKTDSSTTGLVRTPGSNAADNVEIDSIELQLHDGSDAVVVADNEYRGAFEDAFRPLMNQAATASKDEKTQFWNQMARAVKAERVTQMDLGEPKNLLAPCRLHAVAEGYTGSHLTEDGGVLELPGPGSISFGQLPALIQAAAQQQSVPGSGRTIDYFIPPAFTEEIRFHVIPPAGFRLKEPSPIAPITLGPASLTTTLKMEADGSLSLKYTLVSPQSRYTPQQAAAMLRDSQKLPIQVDLRLTLFNLAREKIDHGDWKAGIALLRENAAAAPSNPAKSLRLADAYVEIGASAEAIKLCQQILARDPNNASAYARLASIYSHDEFGRPFQTGMNLAEAEKSYRKAIELDPDEKSYVIQLANLYTYDAAGLRYWDSARLKQALEEFRQAGIDALAKYNALNDYALGLLIAKQYAEIKKLFLYPQADQADPAIKLAAIAASSGPTDAQQEADFMVQAPDKQRIALLEAARFLLLARQFAPAAALFEMAGRTGAAIPPADLDLFRKARNFDESTVSKRPAIAALQRFIAAILDSPDPDSWKEFVVPESRGIPAVQYRSQLIRLFSGVSFGAQASNNLPLMADILTTALDFTAEGNDALGFRIRVMQPDGKQTRKTIAYVSKAGDKYLVVGLWGAAASSDQALTRCENGDLPGARQWLDWANDELPYVKLTDPMAGFAFQKLWPPISAATPDLVKAAAASLAVTGPSYARGLAALRQVRDRISDPELQNAVDQALAETFLAHGNYADAIAPLERLRVKWSVSKGVANDLALALIYANRIPEASAIIESLARSESGSLDALRLEQRSLARQQKFAEAAAVEAKICANHNASAVDFNDRAWLGLFAQTDDKVMLASGQKAVELTQGQNTAFLQTLAVVQASTGALNDARANAYLLLSHSALTDDLLTIFGRIAEQLDLHDVAVDYYSRVKKPQAELTPTNYDFAHLRLEKMTRTEKTK